MISVEDRLGKFLRRMAGGEDNEAKEELNLDGLVR
jgi:hypothetical protein